MKHMYAETVLKAGKHINNSV